MDLEIKNLVYIFADETKIVDPFNCIEDCPTLRSALTELITWSEKWEMPFNNKNVKGYAVRKEIMKIFFKYELSECW